MSIQITVRLGRCTTRTSHTSGRMPSASANRECTNQLDPSTVDAKTNLTKVPKQFDRFEHAAWKLQDWGGMKTNNSYEGAANSKVITYRRYGYNASNGMSRPEGWTRELSVTAPPPQSRSLAVGHLDSLSNQPHLHLIHDTIGEPRNARHHLPRNSKPPRTLSSALVMEQSQPYNPPRPYSKT